MIEWKRRLDGKWATLRFGDLKVTTEGDQYLYEVQVHHKGLAPSEIRVELYADGVQGGAPVRQEMECLQPPGAMSSGHVYRAAVPASRPQADYTPRVIPRHDDMKVPLEEARILWQR